MFTKPHEQSGVGRYEAGSGMHVSETLDASCEKRLVYEDSWVEEGDPKSSRKVGGGWKVLAPIFIGCCIGLGWLLTDCTPAKVLEQVETQPATYEHLVKYAAAASSPVPTPTGVLDVFQVYQPVLAPNGAVDETVLSDGQENTTNIASTSPSSSCEVLLMKYDFAYSYGTPFVGMYSVTIVILSIDCQDR